MTLHEVAKSEMRSSAQDLTPDIEEGVSFSTTSTPPTPSTDEKLSAQPIILPSDPDTPVPIPPLVTTPQPPPPYSRARLIALVTTLTGAALLNTISVQAVVIILPTIGRDLSIPAARLQWVVSAYPLAFGCFLLLWGRLADVYGKRPIFIGGSAWLALITLTAPFVKDEIGFDVMRGLQGLGAAANVPTAIGILGTTFPPGKGRNYAFAAYSSGAPMGAIIGNLLGGLVSQYVEWEWVFWILAMVAVGVTIAGFVVIPVPRKQSGSEVQRVKNAVDWIGGAVVTIGLVLLMFALTEGNIVGWKTSWVIALIVISIALVAAFVVWQLYLEKRTSRRPLMKVTIFANIKVSAAMLIMPLFVSSFNGYMVFVTFFYQDYQGLSVIQTTLRFLPTGICGCLTILATSQLLAKVDVQYLVIWGLVCCSISSLLFAVPISPDTTYWAYGFPAMCLSVFAADTLYPSLILFTAHSLPQEDQAIGGAMINAVSQIGRSIGLAIAVAIQTTVQESKSSAVAAVSGTNNVHNPAFLAGLRAANWFDFGTAWVGVVIAVFAFRGAGKMGVAHK